MDFKKVRRSWESSKKKYEEAVKKLDSWKGDPELLPRLAQEAQNAWSEFKRNDVEYQNAIILQKMSERYGI